MCIRDSRDTKMRVVFYNHFCIFLPYTELCTKVWAFWAVQQQLKCPKNFTVSELTPYQLLGFGYAPVVMCTNIILTCHINYIGSAQTSSELYACAWAETGMNSTAVDVLAQSNTHNSGLVCALPIKLMVHVSVIFVHMITKSAAPAYRASWLHTHTPRHLKMPAHMHFASI